MNKFSRLIVSVIALVICLGVLYTSPHGQVSPNLILGGAGLCFSVVITLLSIFDLRNK